MIDPAGFLWANGHLSWAFFCFLALTLGTVLAVDAAWRLVSAPIKTLLLVSFAIWVGCSLLIFAVGVI